MKITPLWLISIMFPAVGMAQQPGEAIDKQLENCKMQANTTVENSQCYVKATRQWDDELNNQYRLLLKDQTESARQKIRAAQRSWIQYKESYNEAIAAYYQQQQGSIWPLVAAEARMNVIRDKAIDLYRLRVSTSLAGEEG
ncbi:lysozyme inhibitor LprI family protein [Mixta tenebrionis]|uniref:DUF1311 domain-containing protein n=1 Tax=Mixta tenebrionis TaxID=2562439 RepID=A0A506VHA1_9GAMM|nr:MULTISPECIES: lysozyme inhibitor LprI family protein [Mixta]QHM76092.1 hypothetical protein C7M52_02055 [Mixta theicola]TPW44619.1 DUF1311 domain-containing protein [Mixta tenebrionis]